MQDFEKDKFISDILQKDKHISSKAEDVFKSFKNNKKNNVVKISSWFSSLLTVAASFVVVAISAGTAIYVNKDKLDSDNTPITTQSSKVAVNGKIVSTGTGEEIVIKNEEVKIEEVETPKNESYIIAEKEDEYVKVVLMNDNRVLVKLKDKYLEEMNWNGSLDDYIEIEGITHKVKDIFIDKGKSILMLMEYGTVEYAKILDKSDADFKEVYFYNCGEIEGLTNIMDFEQKEEPIWNSEKMYNYVIAQRVDKKKKEIYYDEYNVSPEFQKKSFTSQDGERTYTVEMDEEKYVQVSGWAGASNNIYYIKDSVLYHLSLADGSTTRLATGVERIWKKEDGQIVVRSKKQGFVLHKLDQYIEIWDWDVSKSPVVETQENEYIILNRKEDNSIDLQFKEGAINTLFENKESKYLENFVYNFYISVNTQENNNQAEKYADASIMHLGTAGIDSKMCVVYAAQDGKISMTDLYEYILKDKTGKFSIINDYRWRDYEETVESIKTKECKVEYEDGTTGKCDIQEIKLEDGKVFYELIRRPQEEIYGVIKLPDGTTLQLKY